MTIKQPTPNHKAELSALWQEAFSEPEEAFETFYATAYSPDRSMICTHKDQVLGALYWFDCLWNEKKVAYLYAIATKRSHRGQGICHRLMNATHGKLKEKGYFGAILVPAEEALFGFYETMGYQPVSLHSQFSILNSQFSKTPISIEEYLTFQKELLPNDAVTHTEAAFSYLSNFAAFYQTEKGILCKTDEMIQEILPYTPGEKPTAMYLPLTEDETLPAYFALPLA